MVEDCLRVLFYRDAASFNRIQIGCVDATGTSVTEPYKLETDWAFAETIRGYGAVYSSY